MYGTWNVNVMIQFPLVHSKCFWVWHTGTLVAITVWTLFSLLSDTIWGPYIQSEVWVWCHLSWFTSSCQVHHKTQYERNQWFRRGQCTWSNILSLSMLASCVIINTGGSKNLSCSCKMAKELHYQNCSLWTKKVCVWCTISHCELLNLVAGPTWPHT